MPGRPSIRVLAVSCSLALACAREDESPDIDLGSLCASNGSFCDGWDALTRCVDGRWSRIACSEVCVGEVLGCLETGTRDFPAVRCQCEDGLVENDDADESDTDTATYACVDAESLAVCETGGCTTFDCAAICAERPEPLLSLGCRDRECVCTALGTACDEASPAQCNPWGYLVSCETNVWTLQDCRFRCEPGLQGWCAYSEEGSAMCVCGDT